MQVMAGINLLQPLLDKAMEYQNEGYGTVFIDIHGQCATLDIRIFEFGWSFSSISGDCKTFTIHLSEEDGFTIDRVNEVIDELQELMDTSVTIEEHVKEQEAIKAERERKQYEELKLKYGN